jgi:hypothetical protein
MALSVQQMQITGTIPVTNSDLARVEIKGSEKAVVRP